MTDPDALQARTLRAYAADADALVPNFDGISSEEILAPVIDLLPPPPSRVLDVGAGTGRDAAWLARRGHQVIAAEPVAELRGFDPERHAATGIVWVDDRLPDLTQVTAQPFDLVLSVAVLQHVPSRHHLRCVDTLARLTAPGGRLIASLRHGRGSPKRACFPIDVDAIVDAAATRGLRLVRRVETLSLQQKNRDWGVTWTWLCLERG